MRKAILVGLAALAAGQERGEGEKRYLYVAVPGIRNSLEWGGAGILVYDLDDGHRLVKRIAANYMDDQDPPGKKPENIKGIAAAPRAGRLYVTTITRLACLDLRTEKLLWVRRLPDGCDRMALSPDEKILYVPTFEKDHWNVVDAATGEVVTRVLTRSGAHNTVFGADGRRVYLGGLRSPVLFVADAAEHRIVQEVGPFGGAVRPFTVNAGQTRAYVCVNGLLGFEVGDLVSGKLLHRVEVPGFRKGPVQRHGCPSHGVGLTPDEKEVWVVDAANRSVHVFDNTVEPPRYLESVKLFEEPGWVTFSLDGRWAYPSTLEVIDVRTRRIVGRMNDEEGRPVMSEKVVEVHFAGGVPVRAGDQFGVGRARPAGR
jgi:DNA-binding beta-propeller fold protein YncE